MDTGSNRRPGDPSWPRTQRLTEAKRAASWLGHVIVGQIIAYIVRHWLP